MYYNIHMNNIVYHGVFIAIYAILYSMLEIEIEGNAGWAKNLPTVASGIGQFTIYHLLMNFIVIMTISYALYSKNYSNWLILFFIIAWFLIEDFVWFCLSPFYTIKKYTQDNIPWHSKQPWLLNSPLHNWIGIIVMFLIAIFSEKTNVLFQSFITMSGIVLGVIILSPIYHNWYIHSHNKHK